MRNRVYYFILIIGAIALGLLSRELSSWFPKWVGDVFWGLMVFFMMGFVLKNSSTANIARLSALLSLGVEVAKLYHTPEIDAFRKTTLGGLLVGHAFSWSNIVCYILGIGIGVMLELLWRKTYLKRKETNVIT